ncbi:MAG: hypothetical protein ACTSVB_09695 [Candidatus Heimdallarchaeaceae archaeon]
MDNLKEIIDKIVLETGKTKDEIHKLISEHKEKLGDLVTEIGAAHIVAKDLNVDLSSREEIEKALPATTPIKDLVPNLNNVSISGRVLRIYGEYTFQSKTTNREGVLQSLIVEDKTGTIRVVCWDQKVADLRNANCKIGDPIRIIGAYTKEGKNGECELHVGNKGYVQIRPSDISETDLPEYKIDTYKIEKIKGTEKDLAIFGKITKKDEEILNFQRNDGTEGYKVTVIIGDETGEVIVNCWNELVAEILKFKIGDLVYINGLNAKIRGDGQIELQSTRVSKIIKLDAEREVKVKKELIRANNIENIELEPLDNINESNRMVSTKGIITSIMPIREFRRNDGTAGLVRNLIISDGTNSIRVVLWDNNAKKINEEDLHKQLKIIGGYTKKNSNFGLEIYCGNQTKIIVEEIKGKLKDLSIDFATIDGISSDQDIINVSGVITNLEPIREIQTKTGETVELQTFNLNDNTGKIRVTCWRNNVKKLVKFSDNDYVQIINAKVKINENYPPDLIITNSTVLIKSDKKPDEMTGFVSGNQIAEIELSKERIKDLDEIKQGEKVVVEGTIIHLYDRQFIYHLCKDCGKKVSIDDDGQFICPTHNVIPETDPLLIFNFVINDGTENLNIVCSRKTAEQVIGMETQSVISLINESESDKAPYMYLKNKNFIGKLVRITGYARLNNYLNVIEVSASKVDFLDYREGANEVLKSI